MFRDICGSRGLFGECAMNRLGRRAPRFLGVVSKSRGPQPPGPVEGHALEVIEPSVAAAKAESTDMLFEREVDRAPYFGVYRFGNMVPPKWLCPNGHLKLKRSASLLRRWT
jgi:hypothetical protein